MLKDVYFTNLLYFGRDKCSYTLYTSMAIVKSPFPDISVDTSMTFNRFVESNLDRFRSRTAIVSFLINIYVIFQIHRL